MPRITRRHFLAASLGLPALLLTCSSPEESAFKPVPPSAPEAVGRLTALEDLPSAPTPVATPEAKSPVELWLFAWDDPIERRLWFAVRQSLERDLPHVHLRQEFYQRPVEEAVAVAAAAGLPPDVALVQDIYFPHWLERNLFVNIQSFVSKSLGQAVASDRPTAALNAFRYYPEAKRLGIGDFYSLPWRFNPRLLYVNEEMLRRNGLNENSAAHRWNLKTANEVATELLQNGPRGGEILAGIGFPESWFQSLPWLWSGRGDILDAEGNASTLDAPEVSDSYQLLQGWRHSSGFSPPPRRSGTDSHAQQFAAQELAMFIGDATGMFRLRTSEVTWRARPLYPIGGGDSQTLATFEGLAVITGAQQIDAAWEFVNWSIGAEVQEHVLESENALPVLGSVLASSRVEPHYVDTLLGESETQRSLPITVNYPLYSPVIAHYYHKMMNGEQASIADTLAELHSILDFILERQTLPNKWQ